MRPEDPTVSMRTSESPLVFLSLQPGERRGPAGRIPPALLACFLPPRPDWVGARPFSFFFFFFFFTFFFFAPKQKKKNRMKVSRERHPRILEWKIIYTKRDNSPPHKKTRPTDAKEGKKGPRPGPLAGMGEFARIQNDRKSQAAATTRHKSLP